MWPLTDERRTVGEGEAARALPIMIDSKNLKVIINTVKILQPAWGGVNLEDLSQPKCFRILDTLRAECEIPIWHDDQGSATVTLAALINALKIARKKMSYVRIAFIGLGAAVVATGRSDFPNQVNNSASSRTRMGDFGSF